MSWENAHYIFKWKSRGAKSHRNSDLNCENKYIKAFVKWKETHQNIYGSYGDGIMDFCFLCNFLISQTFYIEHVIILQSRKCYFITQCFLN